jgi:branched-subunit amino acid transport protein AzlD
MQVTTAKKINLLRGICLLLFLYFNLAQLYFPNFNRVQFNEISGWMQPLPWYIILVNYLPGGTNWMAVTLWLTVEGFAIHECWKQQWTLSDYCKSLVLNWYLPFAFCCFFIFKAKHVGNKQHLIQHLGLLANTNNNYFMGLSAELWFIILLIQCLLIYPIIRWFLIKTNGYLVMATSIVVFAILKYFELSNYQNHLSYAYVANIGIMQFSFIPGILLADPRVFNSLKQLIKKPLKGCCILFFVFCIAKSNHYLAQCSHALMLGMIVFLILYVMQKVSMNTKPYTLKALISKLGSASLFLYMFNEPLSTYLLQKLSFKGWGISAFTQCIVFGVVVFSSIIIAYVYSYVLNKLKNALPSMN